MSKYTPGPWNVYHAYEIDGVLYVTHIVAEDGVVVEGDEGHDLRITRGNVHLIAAAPDLLEALQAALTHERHEDGKCGCWTLKAEAAINKALKGDK